MTECIHPIFDYLGGNQARLDGTYGQLHRCIDCGHEENDVPKGSVMVGHAPGECGVCDKYAETVSPEEKVRWIELTKAGRAFAATRLK